MTPILEGIRVLDLSRYVAGPLCSTVLGDLGAEVIRIESPSGGEDRDQGPVSPTGDNLRYTMCNRNKKGLALDLAQPKGQALFRKLVAKSDVIVEAFSPPVKAKLGLTYEAMNAIKADIIFVSISGFGTNGPDADRLCFDAIAQAESGAMSLTGFPDGLPTRSQVLWVDESTALHGAIGVLAALMHRKETGEGQMIELALLDTAVSMTGFVGPAAECQTLGHSRPRIGNGTYYAYQETFTTSDGGLILIAAIANPIWRRLMKLIGHPELCDDPRFVDDASRFQHRQIITETIADWMARRSAQEVMDTMTLARIPCGRVKTVGESIEDPQVQARELFQLLEVPGIGPVIHPRLAIRMSRTPTSIRSAAPAIGQHNEELLVDLLGISQQELADLEREGVI